MPSNKFLDIQGIRKMLTIPSYVFDDKRVSLGAKGLYVQLLYSNTQISSLNELKNFTNNTEEELMKYFTELAQFGYLELKENSCKLISQVPKAKVDPDSVSLAKKYAETTQPKKLSIFEKMTGLVNSYPDQELSYSVKQILITYFTLRLRKKGRFANAEDLHGYVVQAMIGELKSFHLSQEDMIKCVQNSIDHEWLKFVNPANQVASSKPTPSFNKDNIRSGTFSMDDIQKFREKAEELEKQGEQGVF